jgi:hypothetical protein
MVPIWPFCVPARHAESSIDLAERHADGQDLPACMSSASRGGGAAPLTETSRKCPHWVLAGTRLRNVRPSGPPPPGRAGPAGGGCEPVGDGDDEAAELIGSFDDELPVERGEHRRQPVELPGPRLDAEPGFGLRICACRGRGLLHGCDAGGKPGPDLARGSRGSANHVMPVRGPGEPERTRCAGSSPAGGSSEPGRVLASAMRSSRKVRSSPIPGSAPVTCRRAEWTMSP